jgi:redox-sensitive bicupin YhaK (pirin superfamily)
MEKTPETPAEKLEDLMLVPGMTHDLGGGFVVRRLLPYRKKRMVGPFIFFDHMGPAEFIPSAETDIRPHPHIGLSTLTYLYEGRMVHRDTLGRVQTILPGEVNWMTSGKGIAHSERAHLDDYGKKVRVQGLQFWVALPDATEDQDPSFAHYEKSTLPVFPGNGFKATVVTGKAFGLSSPVKVSSPSVFVDIAVKTESEISFTPEKSDFEIAIYVLKGKVTYRNAAVEAGHLAILRESANLNLTADPETHFVMIGGEPFQTPRFIYWNFVSSSREKIEVAKKNWKEENWPTIPGEHERIPLGD